MYHLKLSFWFGFFFISLLTLWTVIKENTLTTLVRIQVIFLPCYIVCKRVLTSMQKEKNKFLIVLVKAPVWFFCCCCFLDKTLSLWLHVV